MHRTCEKRSYFILLLLLITLFCSNNQLIAQPEDVVIRKKGSFFFYWGYNRSRFSKSNLHFNGPDYDFTLYNVRAKDRPTKFGLSYFRPSTLSIPQYNYRLGYFITDRFAVSLGLDHMKYVVTPGQETTISGVITSAVSDRYAGTYLNQPIKLSNDLLQFEHTDGLNLLSLDVEYLQPLNIKLHRDFSFYWNVGIGGVWMITKTKVKVLGEGLDNDFHLAGYTMAGKTGPRIEYKNRFFILGEIKGGYASLPSVLIKNDSPEIGDHNLSFLEYYFAIGVNWGFKSRR